jgi:hypothetical protein
MSPRRLVMREAFVELKFRTFEQFYAIRAGAEYASLTLRKLLTKIYDKLLLMLTLYWN